MSSEARKTSLAYLDSPLTLITYSFFQINAKNILDSRKRKQLCRKRKQLRVIISPIVYIFSLLVKT